MRNPRDALFDPRCDALLTRYRRDASLVGMDPVHPQAWWLQDWLQNLIAERSLTYARVMANAISAHYHSHEITEAINDSRTMQLLRFSAELIAMPATLIEATDPPGGDRVLFYAKQHCASSTLATYRRYARRWETYAEACNFEPQTPRPSDVAEFLDRVGRRGSYRLARHTLYALRYYFRCIGTVDVTRTSLVCTAMHELARAARAPRIGLLTLSRVRSMLKSLTTHPLDQRDAILVLLGFLGGLHAEELQALTTQRCLVTDDLVQIVLASGFVVLIPRVADSLFDLGAYLQRWMQLIPAGPLFPGNLRRSDTAQRPMCVDTIHAAVQRVADRVGFTERRIFFALKRGFIHETVPLRGATAVAHHLRRSIGAIEHHYGPQKTVNGAYRRRMRGIAMRRATVQDQEL